MNQKLCSAVEAADMLRQSKAHILDLAARGILRLYIKVPSDVFLYSIDVEHASPSLMPQTFGNPPYPPTLLSSESVFLEVGIEQSKSLSSNGFAHQSIFDFSLTVSPEGNLIRGRAPVPTSFHPHAVIAYKIDVGSLARRFVTYSKFSFDQIERTGKWEISHAVEIDALHLHVLRSQLSALPVENNKQFVDFSSDVKLVVQSYTSRKLRDLHALLLELWGTNHILTNIPSKKSIEEILKRRYKFSQNQAEHGAAMIRRASTTKWLDGTLKLSASEITALIHCSDYWADSSPGEKSSYPANEEIEKPLREDYKFPAYRAEVAASIIRPEWGETAGRRATLLPT